METVDWIKLAEDRDRWWAHVNTAINLQIPYNVGNYITILLHGVQQCMNMVLYCTD